MLITYKRPSDKKVLILIEQLIKQKANCLSFIGMYYLDLNLDMGLLDYLEAHMQAIAKSCFIPRKIPLKSVTDTHTSLSFWVERYTFHDKDP